MTVTTADILTAETVPQYLKDRWDIEDGLGAKLGGTAEAALEGVTVSAIQGGNVNYAFCVRLPGLDNKAIFLKQAPEFVAIFGPDGFPLTSERMQREMDVYSEWKGLLGETLDKKYLPEIYYFDSEYIFDRNVNATTGCLRHAIVNQLHLEYNEVSSQRRESKQLRVCIYSNNSEWCKGCRQYLDRVSSMIYLSFLTVFYFLWKHSQ